MKCEICNDPNPKLTMMLPLHQPNGKQITAACEKCGINSKAYCPKHERVHQGYRDNTTACLGCVEDLVKKSYPEVQQMWTRLATLPPVLTDDLEDMIDTRVAISKSSKDEVLLKIFAAKALRMNLTIEEILKGVLESQSVEDLLWR